MRKAILFIIFIISTTLISAQPVVDDEIPDAMPLAERPEGDDLSIFLLIGAMIANMIFNSCSLWVAGVRRPGETPAMHAPGASLRSSPGYCKLFWNVKV